jgi:hypothetical protein
MDLSVEDAHKVMGHLDSILRLCGYKEISPMLDVLEKEFPIKSAEVWNTVYKDVVTAMSSGFTSMNNELDRYLNDPVKLQELKDKISASN